MSIVSQYCFIECFYVIESIYDRTTNLMSTTCGFPLDMDVHPESIKRDFPPKNLYIYKSPYLIGGNMWKHFRTWICIYQLTNMCSGNRYNLCTVRLTLDG
jgi:hypothetical protein